MKKIIYLFMVVLVVGVFNSCKDQDEIYKEWVVPGGSVYPEKANGMNYNQGNMRLLLKWAMPKDPSVSKAVITWSNGEKSAEINYADFVGEDSVKFEVGDLKEQSYTFFVTNYDAEGNKSVSSQITASPYGTVWLSTHAERMINSAEVTSGTDATLSIGFGTTDMVGTKFRYVNNDGEWVETEPVSVIDNKATLPNAMVNRRYEYCSGYCPAEGLDTIWNEWSKGPTPIGGRLQNDGWEVTATGSNAGHEPAKVLDGLVSDTHAYSWQWNNGGKWPVVLQIDMKKDTYVISRMRVVNFVSSLAYRRLFNVTYAFGDHEFNLDPGAEYAAPSGSPWPIYNAPTFADAKFIRSTTFYNGDASHNETGNNTQCRYIACVFHNSRLSSQIACQEIELYGYDANAE